MKLCSIEETMESFIQDILKPYRKLSIQLSEQAVYSNPIPMNREDLPSHLLQLKKAAIGLISSSASDNNLTSEREQLNKCIQLFITAVDLQISMLFQTETQNNTTKAQQQQSQHYLTSMSKNLAALKQSLKKEG